MTGSADLMDPAARGRDGRREVLDRVVFGSLFPQTLHGAKRIVLIFGLIVIGTALSLARTPLDSWNTLWAEDGPVFVRGALIDGPGALLQGYSGYMHLVPRIGAAIASLFPLATIPTAVTIVSAFFTSLIACACFLLVEQRFASIPLRFVAWAMCFLLPIMGGEIVNNLANLHWYLLIAAYIAVLVKADRPSMRAVQAAVLFAAVTSDALALLLLPFVIFRLIVIRGWRSRLPDFIYLAGALLQLVVVVSQMLSGTGRQVSDSRPSVREFLDFYVYRVVFGGLFGTSTSEWALSKGSAVLPGLVLAMTLTVILVGAVLGGDRRVFIIALAFGSVAFSAVVFSMQWNVLEVTGLLEFFSGARYTAVPTALLLLALLQAVDLGLLRVRKRSFRALWVVIVVIAVAVPMIKDFRPVDLRAEAEAWTDQLTAARERCADAEADQPATLLVAPTGFPGVLLTCGIMLE